MTAVETQYLLLRCSNCGHDFRLPMKVPYFGKKIKVACKNSNCNAPMIEKVPEMEFWRDQLVLSTIPIANGYLKYYNSHNRIQKVKCESSKILIKRGDHTALIKDELFFKDNSISNRHCEIISRWDINNQVMKYVIVDLGSTNGTWVNDVKLNPSQEHILDNGAIIKVGNQQLVFEQKIG